MSRKSRKPATLAEHRDMALRLKTAELAVGDVLHDDAMLYSYEARRLAATLFSLARMRSRLEDAMLIEHPELPWSEACTIYYPNGDDAARDELNKHRLEARRRLQSSEQ